MLITERFFACGNSWKDARKKVVCFVGIAIFIENAGCLCDIIDLSRNLGTLQKSLYNITKLVRPVTRCIIAKSTPSEIIHFYRAKDRAEAKLIIEFLNTALTETSFSEVKEVIADLLKNKIQELSLIEVSNFYVYEYIDQPVAPEKKLSPNRALICILGAFFGFLFGVVIVLARHYFNQIDSNIIFKENS